MKDNQTAEQQEVQALLEKWEPALNQEGFAPITESGRRLFTARMLENQANALTESAANTTGGIQGYDPVLIKMVRRSAPVLIAHDLVGVQSMNMPTGLIFAMRARYNAGFGSEEALFNEANSAHSGTGHQVGGDPFGVAAYTTGEGMATDVGEAATAWNEMGFTIEKVPVVAKTRQLRSTYSLELAQDLRAIHGLDAETELTNILSSEVISETNREIVRTLYIVSKQGVQYATTPGTYDMLTDSDGRWSAERYKSLAFAIEREANAISLDTRRGKGNVIVTSADVASALVMAGVMDYAPALSAAIQMDVDASGVSYAGNFGRYKVFVDPYLTGNGVLVGYRGANVYDAGVFYCPYVPATMYQAQDPVTFQPALGLKTRYAMASNPLSGSLSANSNGYYRKFGVTNLM